MEWSDIYKIEVIQVDNQHKELFNKIDIFEKSVAAGDGYSKMGKMLKDVVDYTKVHFATEEELMKRVGYEARFDHKKLHKNIVADIVKILLIIQSGKKYNVNEFVNFLDRWLKSHILVEDMKIGVHIRNSNFKIE